MRLEGSTLVISERNARALLAKLEGYPENSACTIGTHEQDFWLKIEPDSVHYADRPAGIMHPNTEEVLRQG